MIVMPTASKQKLNKSCNIIIGDHEDARETCAMQMSSYLQTVDIYFKLTVIKYGKGTNTCMAFQRHSISEANVWQWEDQEQFAIIN
jgi:hypothetical protein